MLKVLKFQLIKLITKKNRLLTSQTKIKSPKINVKIIEL